MKVRTLFCVFTALFTALAVHTPGAQAQQKGDSSCKLVSVRAITPEPGFTVGGYWSKHLRSAQRADFQKGYGAFKEDYKILQGLEEKTDEEVFRHISTEQFVFMPVSKSAAQAVDLPHGCMDNTVSFQGLTYERNKHGFFELNSPKSPVLTVKGEQKKDPAAAESKDSAAEETASTEPTEEIGKTLSDQKETLAGVVVPDQSRQDVNQERIFGFSNIVVGIALLVLLAAFLVAVFFAVRYMKERNDLRKENVKLKEKNARLKEESTELQNEQEALKEKNIELLGHLAAAERVTVRHTLPKDLVQEDGLDDVYLPYAGEDGNGNILVKLEGSKDPVLKKNINNHLRKNAVSRKQLGLELS